MTSEFPEEENKNADAIVIWEGTPVTKDFRLGIAAMRLWNGIVFSSSARRTNKNKPILASSTGKNSWPQLPGAIGKKAEKLIGNENKTVDAIIVRGGSSVPEDFRCDRVWLWVNHCDIVTRVFVVG